MKNILKIIPVVFILAGLTVQSLGCASTDAQTVEDKVVTVQRGNLAVDITAVGNLALSRTEDLAFDIPSTFSKTSPITVEEVFVEAGDSVQEGQELVKLDTLEWDKQLKTLEKELVTAQRDLATAQRKVTEKEFAVSQAQLDLQSAEDDLDQIDAVKAIQDEVDDAEAVLKACKMALSGQLTGTDITYWTQQVTIWTEKRNAARSDLQELLRDSVVTLTTGSTAEMSRDIAMQVAEGALRVEQKQMDLEDAQIAVETAKLDEVDAEQDVTDAQNNLDEARSLSPIIKAPFDGFITEVNVEGGDEILKGTVAMQIADPNKFEAEIMVSENDILQMKLEGPASVQVQALQGVSLPAEVTQISPTATIQSGVVNYKVKVELTSLRPLLTQRQAGTAATGNVTSSAPSGVFEQAFGSGNLTQEQINQMIQQRRQAQSGQSSLTPSTLAGEVKLTEGLTVTVNITTEERNNALLVPNAAIISRGNETLVQVLKDGVTEERSVQTGISNWQYTEITSGLSEGEQVVIPAGATTTSATSQQRQEGGFFIGGMGGPR